MDAKQLAEIKARCDAATPGPWYADGWAAWDDLENTFVELSDFGADAKFIAHARTDIPALVAEVERLQNENKHLKEELREWENMTPEEAGEMLAGM